MFLLHEYEGPNVPDESIHGITLLSNSNFSIMDTMALCEVEAMKIS